MGNGSARPDAARWESCRGRSTGVLSGCPVAAFEKPSILREPYSKTVRHSDALGESDTPHAARVRHFRPTAHESSRVLALRSGMSHTPCES